MVLLVHSSGSSPNEEVECNSQTIAEPHQEAGMKARKLNRGGSGSGDGCRYAYFAQWSFIYFESGIRKDEFGMIVPIRRGNM